MTDKTDAERLGTLEKRVAELATLLHYQDSLRVKIEKSIGVIDQQLIKTDAGLNQLRQQLTAKAVVKKAKPAPKPKAKPKGKTKAKAKVKGKKRK